jgi:hypothetical protein
MVMSHRETIMTQSYSFNKSLKISQILNIWKRQPKTKITLMNKLKQIKFSSEYFSFPPIYKA